MIVSTCASAGLLALLLQSEGVLRTGETPAPSSSSWWWFVSHIFIDESSQAQMPEVLVPLALSSPETRVVSPPHPPPIHQSVS